MHDPSDFSYKECVEWVKRYHESKNKGECKSVREFEKRNYFAKGIVQKMIDRTMPGQPTKFAIVEPKRQYTEKERKYLLEIAKRAYKETSLGLQEIAMRLGLRHGTLGGWRSKYAEK